MLDAPDPLRAFCDERTLWGTLAGSSNSRTPCAVKSRFAEVTRRSAFVRELTARRPLTLNTQIHNRCSSPRFASRGLRVLVRCIAQTGDRMEFRVQWFRRIAALSATAFAFSVVTATEGVARAADPASADVAVPGAVADVATSSPSSAASGSPAPGSASEAPQASPAPPVAQSENKPEPIGGVLGDFGDGERSALLKKGLSLQSTFLTEAAGNITGGRPIGGNAVVRGTANAGQFNFGFDEDFNKLFNSSAAGTLHFLLTSRIGSRIATTGVGSLSKFLRSVLRSEARLTGLRVCTAARFWKCHRGATPGNSRGAQRRRATAILSSK